MGNLDYSRDRKISLSARSRRDPLRLALASRSILRAGLCKQWLVKRGSWLENSVKGDRSQRATEQHGALASLYIAGCFG
jgi:hypothetical protein